MVPKRLGSLLKVGYLGTPQRRPQIVHAHERPAVDESSVKAFCSSSPLSIHLWIFEFVFLFFRGILLQAYHPRSSWQPIYRPAALLLSISVPARTLNIFALWEFESYKLAFFSAANMRSHIQPLLAFQSNRLHFPRRSRKWSHAQRTHCLSLQQHPSDPADSNLRPQSKRLYFIKKTPLYVVVEVRPILGVSKAGLACVTTIGRVDRLTTSDKAQMIRCLS